MASFVGLEQQVERGVRLAAVLQPDVGHDRRVLGEALELLGAEDPRPQVLELELHGSSTHGGRAGVKRVKAACALSAVAVQPVNDRGLADDDRLGLVQAGGEVVAGRDLAERDEHDPQDSLVADDHRVLVGGDRVGGGGAGAVQRVGERLHAGHGGAERVGAPGVERRADLLARAARSRPSNGAVVDLGQALVDGQRRAGRVGDRLRGVARADRAGS